MKLYDPKYKRQWNTFVRASKNGTFLFDRDFIEYHGEKFADASLIAFEGEGDDNIVALLPANRDHHEGGDWLVSHAGLTYGGWVTDSRMTTPGMLRLIELLRGWCQTSQVVNVRYKAMPRCYHRLPAEEDLYALYVNDARLVRQDVTSVIDLVHAPGWSKGKKHSLAKAMKAGVQVEQRSDYAAFVTLLMEVLARHGASPVHSAAELELLKSRFAEQVKLFGAVLGGRPIAYVLVFDCGPTVHLQYIASSEEGRRLGGIEAIIYHLQRKEYRERKYLNFGISTEQDGRVLNRGLIGQKEMFGGRAMIASFFDLMIHP